MKSSTNIAWGWTLLQSQKALTVVVGFDARATSPDLAYAVAQGICDAGADVLDIVSPGRKKCMLLYQNLEPARVLRLQPPIIPLTTMV